MTLALDQFAAVITEGKVTSARDLDWSRVGYEHTAFARATWASQYAPAGARVRVAAVKGAMKTAWRMGLLSAEQFQRAIDLPPVGGESLPRGRALSADEIDALLGVCATDSDVVLGRRDAAIFALFRSGMRVGELVALNLADWRPSPNDEPDAIAILHGKGAKGRWGYLDQATGAFVRAWLEVRGSAAGPLMCSVRRLRNPGRLTTRHVAYVCAVRGGAAGLPPFTPHDFRRTTATELKLAGIPLPDIQSFLGHKSIITTRKYFRDDEEAAKRRAAQALARPRLLTKEAI